MTRPLHRRQTLVAGLVFCGILAVLTGCVAEDSRFGSFILGDIYALSPDSERELTRFRQVYEEYGVDPGESPQYEHFRDAFARVKNEYVYDLPATQLIDTAIAGVRKLNPQPHSMKPTLLVEAALDSMIENLDPHSAYLNPEELLEMRVSMQGEFGGLGIRVSGENGVVKVISPIDNTPASRAGIKSGDVISHVNGEAIGGLTLTDAVKRMRGRPGTDIRLTIVRNGVPSFEVTVTRAIIKVDAVQWRAEGNIGYIKVNSFVGKMEDDVTNAIRQLRRELGPRLAGLVLDLRENPGGLLDESVFLADAFLDTGRIVSVRGQVPHSERAYNAEPGDFIDGLPMVVLINDGSASASEIVAGALQDNGRATVMGSRSFGKGTVQTIMPLPLEGAVKFTTALYYLPSGRTIQGQGIEPDIAVTGIESADHRREASLPKALPSATAGVSRVRATVDVQNCPKVGAENDALLGCALSFLRSGSDEKFMARVGHTM